MQNPNSARRSVYDGAYVKVEVQDKTFATGVSDAGGTLPGFSEAVVEVPVTVSMLRMVRQVIGLKDGAPADPIRYSMSGKLGYAPVPRRRGVLAAAGSAGGPPAT